ASGTSNPTTQFAVALNGGTTPVTNTTVSVAYNMASVNAFGNSANNTVAVSALNSGNATVAVQNTQTNTGAVTASFNGMGFGSAIGAPGAITSTVGVANNTVSVSAVGNTATTAIK
ncbi:MAG: hypothetical protein B7Z77_07830, partial [Acidocella sp. 20-58-15]